MHKGGKPSPATKRPATAHGENASRLANKTIPEEPTREDRQTTYTNSLESNALITSKILQFTNIFRQ